MNATDLYLAAADLPLSPSHRMSFQRLLSACERAVSGSPVFQIEVRVLDHDDPESDVVIRVNVAEQGRTWEVLADAFAQTVERLSQAIHQHAGHLIADVTTVTLHGTPGLLSVEFKSDMNAWADYHAQIALDCLQSFAESQG
jgi:hypothetical protein